MFSHDDMWRAIDRLAAAFGYSPSGLAKKAGLDPTTFNKSKRMSADGKPRWPSTESLSKILAVTGSTMSDFIALIGTDDKDGSDRHQTIPIIGYAQAGKAGYFDDAGYATGDGWDEVAFPEHGSTVRHAHIYALEVSGASMEPVYREGDVLVISPDAGIRRGDRIVVRTARGEVMAKQLSRQTANRIELKSLNPEHENHSLRPDEISWMARIIWVSQ